MKTLTQPLSVLLIFQIFGLALCWTQLHTRKTITTLRPTLTVVSLAVLVLAVLSMPVVGELLQDSLAIPPPAGNAAPDYVVVLSGGLEEGTSPDLDVLSSETTRRVLYGVRYWRMHPSARIVMSGAVGKQPARVTELMAEVASCHGVPRARIIRETKAVNTREQPLRLRALPGFTPTTHLAIVTSGYHERRAVAEFRRYFIYVDPQPVPSDRHRRLEYWLPDDRGLLYSTAAIHEWIGIVWYRVRALSYEGVERTTAR
jgi:uncharacterized SAM-binding protein YcdF (DUF218 family)